MESTMDLILVGILIGVLLIGCQSGAPSRIIIPDDSTETLAAPIQPLQNVTVHSENNKTRVNSTEDTSLNSTTRPDSKINSTKEIIKYCAETSWIEIFKDSGYSGAYNSLEVRAEAYTGIFTYFLDEKCKDAALQRCTPYKLDGVSVYTGSRNLERFIGYKVIILGKKHSFGLEGYILEEIWPIGIKCFKKA